MTTSGFQFSLVEAIVPLLIQSTFLLWLAFGGAFLVRKRGAAAQSLVYRAALAGLLALVVCCAVGVKRYSGLSRIPAPPLEVGVGVPLPKAEPPSEPARSASSYQTLPTIARTDQVTVGSLSAMVGQVWMIGAVAILLWTFGCHVVLLGLRRNSKPVTDDETQALLTDLCARLRVRKPLLLTGSWVRGPFLNGLGEPAIFLPQTYWTDFSDEALRAVLAHELIHLRRADCWWNLAARIACAVGWMHPLVWVLRRRMEQAAEEACDEEVLRIGCSAREYALCLTDLAERLLPIRSARVAGAAVVPYRSGLGRRVERLFTLAEKFHAPLGLFGRGMVWIGSGLGVALVLSMVSAQPAYSRSGPESRPMHTGIVTGKIVNEDGSPAAKVKVFARLTPRPEVNRLGMFGLAETKQDGTYRFQGLQTGTFSIFLSRPSVERTAAAVVATALDGATVSAPEMRMIAGGLIRGRVVDDAGAPLEGVYVTTEGPDRPLAREAFGNLKTDSDGHFEVRVSPGKTTLWVIGPVDWNQTPIEREEELPARKVEVAMQAGETRDVELRADTSVYAAGVIAGRVVFPDGKPASGIKVMAQIHHDHGQYRRSRRSDGVFSWAEAVSGPDGSYRLTGLMNAPYNVAVDDPSKEWIAPAAERTNVQLRQTTQAPNIVLTRGALVVGTVTDEATGKPLSGVPIGSYGPHRPQSSGMIISVDTDASGRYQMRVAPGTSYLYVPDPRYGQGLNTTLTLAEGDTRELPFRVKAVSPDEE